MTHDMRHGARARWFPLWGSAASVLILFVGAVWISAASVPVRGEGGGGGFIGSALSGLGDTVFLGILLRNVAVALTLYSGVLSVGLGSLIGVVVLGFIVGATSASAAAEVGFGSMLGSVAPYALLELPAFLLAATAGLLPVVAAALRISVHDSGALRRFSAAMPTSLSLLVAAVALLVLGAGVETVLITRREG